MNILLTYLLSGSAGKKSIPYKLWVLSSQPGYVSFGPNDSIILGGFSYTASPFTSQRNAGVARLNPITNTILWSKRYAVNHQFSDNESNWFGPVYYNSSANKLWSGADGARYGTFITLNPDDGTFINSAIPVPNYISNFVTYTSDVQTIYGTSKRDNYNIDVCRFTIGSSTNTATAGWYSTWSNTGADAELVQLRNQGGVYASGDKSYMLLDTYNSSNDNIMSVGIVATNSNGSSGNYWTFANSFANNNINEPFGGIFTDYSGNIYISKGYAARGGSFPNRRLVSYNSSLGHRYTYYPSLPGYVSSGIPNLNIVVLGSDSSNNLYLGISTIQAGLGGSFLRIAKVNQSGTILWQYSCNTAISSVVAHPTDPNVILLLFSNSRVMTQKSSELITGTWGTITISQTSDLSLVSESEYWPAQLNSGNRNFSMTHTSQTAPNPSISSTNISNQSLSVSSTTTIA